MRRPSARLLRTAAALSMLAGLLRPGSLDAQQAATHAATHGAKRAAHAEPARQAVDRASVEHPDNAGIRAALEHYLQGHATGDSAHFRAAFHPEARLFWMRDGAFAQRTSEEYIAGAGARMKPGQPPAPRADEAQRSRRILMIDRAGDAAVAKIELDYPQARIVDYMSLLKVGEEWRIVNKTFHSAPKAVAAKP